MLFTITMNAQNVKFGVKGGLNVSNLPMNYPSNEFVNIESNRNFGYHLGGFLEYKIKEKFYIQPELLLSLQGNEIVQSFSTPSFGGYWATLSIYSRLYYLNMPIMLKYKVNEKFYIELGPQIGYIISANADYKYEDSDSPKVNSMVNINLLEDGKYRFLEDTVDFKSTINRFDLGLNVGFSYDISKNIFIQGRYNFGLSKVNEEQRDEEGSIISYQAKNSVLQFSLGYKF